MDFFGYETCENLLWKSGEGYRNTNATSKKVIPKINMNMTYNSATLGFGCFPHKETCRKFDFTEIASIFINKQGGCIDVYKEGEIKTRHWTTNNLWLSILW